MIVALVILFLDIHLGMHGPGCDEDLGHEQMVYTSGGIIAKAHYGVAVWKTG